MKYEWISHLIAVLSLTGFFYYRHVQYKVIDDLHNELSVCHSEQEKKPRDNLWVGSRIPDVEVTNDRNQRRQLTSLFGETECSVLIYTSLEGCDACRDAELKRWGLIKQQGLEANIVLLLPTLENGEQDLIEKSRNAQSLAGSLPVFFDSDNRLFLELDKGTANKTHVFLLGSDGNILLHYIAEYENQDKSNHYADLFFRLH